MTAKKSTSPIGGAEAVEAYLAGVAEPARSTLIRVRETIRSFAPEGMLEGFYYGVPAFTLPGGGVAGYAALKGACSYYPMSGRVITLLKEELKSYATSSGAIQFQVDKPLPKALIGKLVKTRLAEIAAKK